MTEKSISEKSSSEGSFAERSFTTRQIQLEFSADRSEELKTLSSQIGGLNSAAQNCQMSFDSLAQSASQNISCSITQTEFMAVERSIEASAEAQMQFNESVAEGMKEADGLKKKMGEIARNVFSLGNLEKAMEMTDELTRSNARLSTIADPGQSVGEVNDMIHYSAQRTGMSQAATADGVVAMKQNAGGSFESTNDAVLMAENLTKEFTMAGMSQSEITAQTVAMAEAMGTGVMSGEVLQSVFSETPAILQNMANYMGMTTDQVRAMAAEGGISSEVFKNAMLSSTEEINNRFAETPKTFQQIWNGIRDSALMALSPLLETLGAGATWLADNWSLIEPILWGIAAAVGFYTLATMAQTAATLSAAAANSLLNTSLLANPIMWIAMAIGLIVFAIAQWINQVGGIQIAWQICMNAIMTAWENCSLQFQIFLAFIQNVGRNLIFVFFSIVTGILDLLSHLKVFGLTILQDFINAAIDKINLFIELMKSIKGASIETISHVTFATEIAVEEEAKRQERQKKLEDRRAEDKVAEAASDNEIRITRAFNIVAQTGRQIQLTGMQAEAENQRAALKPDDIPGYTEGMTQPENLGSPTDLGGYSGGGFTGGGGYGAGASIPQNIAQTADNTKRMADSVDIAEEDLQYMRDAAEQEIINRFTLAELKVDINNNNTLKTTSDFEEIERRLFNATNEILRTAAEGAF